MFGYEILRNKWAIVVLIGGTALVFYAILFLFDYYRERKVKKDNPEEYETEYLTAWQAFPWAVKLTMAVIVAFGIIYSINILINPTSW